MLQILTKERSALRYQTQPGLGQEGFKTTMHSSFLTFQKIWIQLHFLWLTKGTISSVYHTDHTRDYYESLLNQHSQ